jgi:hypothetical protein
VPRKDRRHQVGTHGKPRPSGAKETQVRNSIRRGLVLAAFAVTALFAVAPAALAQATVSPEGFGLESNKLLATVAPTPLANPTTPAPMAVTSVTVPTTFNALGLSASVSTNQAQAKVTSMNTTGLLLPLLGTMSSGAITSSCVANSNGTFTLVSNVTSLSVGGSTFTGEAAVNHTFVTVGTTTVILNQQVAGPVTGSETVNAIDFHFALGSDALIASSTCGPWASPVPIASGKGLALGLGLVGSVGVGYGTIYARRRSWR